MRNNIVFPNLVAAMARNGDNLRTIGKLLNMTAQSVCRKMSGKVEWKRREIELICQRYNKSYEELFK